jgi:hypothetical protein
MAMSIAQIAKARWKPHVDDPYRRARLVVEEAEAQERQRLLAEADAADRARIEARRAETASARRKDRRRQA